MNNFHITSSISSKLTGASGLSRLLTLFWYMLPPDLPSGPAEMDTLAVAFLQKSTLRVACYKPCILCVPIPSEGQYAQALVTIKLMIWSQEFSALPSTDLRGMAV